MTVSSKHLMDALARLDAWLQTMRQDKGYGGPVAHWWRDQFLYTGPGLDWRYEGILVGYSELWTKTNNPVWLQRIQQATNDLKAGQMADGNFMMSEFERNPGTLGTPHEAAASLGLLKSSVLTGDETGVVAARRNLSHLVGELWDPDSHGFNDRPGTPGRVPNKLATLSHALCLLAESTGDTSWLDYARAAIDDVLRFQVPDGPYAGAIHQYAADNRHGDGRLFPFYNARCVEPLVVASRVFEETKYLAAAEKIMGFLEHTMTPEGLWPQICYLSGKRAEYPRWIAGTADILYAFHVMGRSVPAISMERLLTSQLPAGGFPTGVGFSRKAHSRASLIPPDYRDMTPVTGWNDKVLRLLSSLLPSPLADVWSVPQTEAYSLQVRMNGHTVVFTETAERFDYGTQWSIVKSEPWARGIIS